MWQLKIEWLVAEQDATGGYGHEAGNGAEERTLARSVGSDQADDLSFVDLQIDTI